ncbi:Rhodopsin domain-containing protein [Madurella fahalii]|uniref:Rhodopsin domain-containing protein n=1 Tax=Madurella fahalii TaxID=1157608 RepID=A0ABQ0GAP3_9PEZI
MSSSTTLDPPPLPDPNEWNGQSATPCAAVALGLATLAVGLRFWARAGILGVLGLEDWFILAALASSIGVTVCLGLELRHGLGKHVVYVEPYDLMMYFKISFIGTIVYVLSMTFTKLSILCLYIRVLTYDRVRLAAKILLGVVLVSHIYILVALFAACVPLDAFWDFSKRETAYCHPLSIYWSHAGLNIVTDFLIFTLPLTVMGKIRATRLQKMALCVIFILAFSVCIISLTRALLLARDIASGAQDVTWGAAETANWNTWEVNIAIICACLTTMKPIVTRFFPGRFSPYSSTLPDEEDTSRGRGPRHRPLHGETELFTMEPAADADAEARQPRTTDCEETRDGEATSSPSLTEMVSVKAG